MKLWQRIFRRDPRPPASVDGLLDAAAQLIESRALQAAHAVVQAALEREPGSARVLALLGRIAEGEGRWDDAIAAYRRALGAEPGEPAHALALGRALVFGSRCAEAVEVLRVGLARAPGDFEMRYLLAHSLMRLKDYEAAEPELAALLERAPGMARLHSALGMAYTHLGRLGDAVAAQRRALELDPADAVTHSNLLLTLNYDSRHSAEEIHAEHRRYGARFSPPVPSPEPDRVWPRRLRVGYVSPDFRNHVVALFLRPILERHDRSRFEVFCYHTHPTEDAVSAEFRALAAHWRACATLSDAELARQVRADRVDILVDLAGHTADNRLGVFALRPAPLQLTYLGYPNTTGLEAMDGRITDALADPPGEAERQHVERLVRLPRVFLCYRPALDAGEPGPPPVLGAGGLTFGCFNAFQKLSEDFFEAAARLLEAVPGSRLLLKSRPLGAESVRRRVFERFAARGVDPARVALRGWVPGFAQHLAVYREVDIALDSFPYHGTTTTCEALWMGVPVVSLRGDRPAARVGASLLHAVGLDELVAEDRADYVRRAAGLARNRERLARLRGELRPRMQRSPLMDEAGLVRALETCYLELWEERLSRAPARAAATAGEAEAAFARAKELDSRGEAAAALEACKAALAREPDHAQALALFARLCREGGEHATAVQWLGRAIAHGAPSAELHYLYGCALEDAGRLDEADAAYRAALAREPEHARAANNLGVVLEKKGERAPAAQCYERALRADPALAQAHYNLGRLRLQAGRFSEALAHLERAVSLEPAHADWREALADARARSRPDAPAQAADQALRLHIGGRVARPGWKILDIEPGPAVDYVGTCTDLSRFADGSVSEIYASHVLEHLGYRRDLPRALAEFHRVLAPGGCARISVPDFEVVCRLFLDPRRSAQERFHLMRIAFGGQVNAHDFHRVGLTEESLRRYLQEAGFARIERVGDFGLFDDTSALVLHGEPVSLNLVAWK